MAFDFRSVMSGRRRDPVAFALRGLLRSASVGYGIAARQRNRRFDADKRGIHHCGVPVISVGNLTTGGTGKTPIVCRLASALRTRDIRVAIVSRGYGRGEGDANDEAMELHDRLPDVPHLQDPDRVASARIAVEELEAQVILMDDGFQHRRLHRDIDLVVIDATCPFGYGHLLPRGLLREPITGLRRADLVMVTRCDIVPQKTLAEIEMVIGGVAPNLPIVRTAHTPTTLLTYPAGQCSSNELRGHDVAVLSAIGNPDAFGKTVEHCGARIGDQKALPDHDPYSPETVKELMRWAEGLRGRVSRIVCTHKDLVKLRTDRLGGVPLSALLIDLTVISGTAALNEALINIVDAATSS